MLRDFELTEHNRSYTVTNTTQHDISMEKWHKKLLKVEFQGYIYSSPKCSRENCEAVYWKRE